jgi:hypothetical protein
MSRANASRATLAIAASVLAACIGASAAQAKDAKTARPPVVDPRADRLLKEMGASLAAAKQYSFRADIVWDEVLPTAQKIQLAAIQDVAVRRPNRAYVEYAGDDGGKRLWYDGVHITLYDAAENVYATTSAPGKIDAAVRELVDAHGFEPPLADLLYADPYAALSKHAQLGLYLGLHDVGGTRCHHLAFVDKEVDWQVWIEDGTQMVPRKLVITYKLQPGSPQFSAVLSEWDLDERLADTVFVPFLPDGAVPIDFLDAKKAVINK